MCISIVLWYFLVRSQIYFEGSNLFASVLPGSTVTHLLKMDTGHIFIWNKTFQLILSILFDWFHVQHMTQIQPNLQHWRFVALFKIFRKYLTLFPRKSLSFSIWCFNWNLILQLSARFSNERLENLDKFFENSFPFKY